MEEEIDFEEQLKQEELEKQQKAEEDSRIKRDEDGTVYEWDDNKKAWFPKIDEDFIANYQMNYGSSDQADTTGEVQSQPPDPTSKEYADYYQYYQQYYQNESESKDSEVDINSEEYYKQYTEYYNRYYAQYYQQQAEDEGQEVNDENETKDKKGKKRKSKFINQKPAEDPKWFDVDDAKNTNVYISGLPLDITDDEFKDLMSKCGMVMFDPQKKCLKLKLYRDEQGEPKGDGRCCYIKVESVDLALKILDGYEVRGHTIHVEKAKFTMKGEFDPSKKRKKLTNKEKKKMKEKQQKLFDWRPERPMGTRLKCEKTVILKNMFSPKDFDDDPTLINELRDDVRSESAKFGEVKNVKIYDNHPEGVMSVSFKQPEEADACISAMNGRWFAKRRITAESWDGRTKYEIQESEAERDERLKKWDKFLDDSRSEKDNQNVQSQANTSQTTSCSEAAGASSITRTETDTGVSSAMTGLGNEETPDSVEREGGAQGHENGQLEGT